MAKIQKLRTTPGNNHPYVLHGDIDPLINTVNELVDAVNKLEKEIKGLKQAKEKE